MEKKYKRILLKLSGETLSGENESGVDPVVLNKTIKEIIEIKKIGTEIAIVIGGGNIWRYRDNKDLTIGRVNSDYLGMLATLMNSVMLKSAIEKQRMKCDVFSAINIPQLAELYTVDEAKEELAEGKIVILAGGTGNPYFTTDSAAALRALELDCEVVLKATKVDYVYSRDPKKDKKAKVYKRLKYDEFLDQGLQVMDLTAISLCREAKIPIIVFNFNKKGNLMKAVRGEEVGTRIG